MRNLVYERQFKHSLDKFAKVLANSFRKIVEGVEHLAMNAVISYLLFAAITIILTCEIIDLAHDLILAGL